MSKIIDDIKIINDINITGTTQSFNQNTGCITVSGGMGILKNLNIGGNLSMTGDFQIKSGTTDNGIITFNVPADDVTDYTITWPRTQGLNDQLLLNDGNGNLSWGNFPASATTGSLTVTGNTELDTLDTSGATTLGATLNVIDNTTIGGTLTVSGASTMSTINVSDQVTITSTSQSFDTTTGALIVSGGVGIVKNLNICGTVEIFNATDSITSSTGALVVAGGVGINGNLNIDENLKITGNSTLSGTLTVTGLSSLTTINTSGNTTIGGVLKITNATDSTTSSTGALIVAGGVGINGNVNIDENLGVTGTSIFSNDISIIGNIQQNATSGSIIFSVPGTVTNYTITWPNTQGTNNQTLINDGSGNLGWGTTVTAAVGIGESFGTDNRMLRTFGTGNDIEATDIIITDSNGIIIPDTTSANDESSTGALVVSGGIAVGKNIDIGTTLEVGTTSTLKGIVTITDTTQVTATGNGALIVSGGVSIDKALRIGGKFAVPIRTATTDDNLDDDYILNVNATGSATITLPDITDDQYNGVTYIVIKQTANTVDLTTQAADKIFDAGTESDIVSLTGAAGQRIQVVSNGNKWFVM